MPRIGNLDQALQIFGYLKSHPKQNLGFEPDHPAINEETFRIFTGRHFIEIPVNRSQGIR